MLPNILLPRVNIRLTAISDSKKNNSPKNDVTILQRNLHFFACFILRDSNSERGTSSVKSASGRPLQPIACKKQKNISLKIEMQTIIIKIIQQVLILCRMYNSTYMCLWIQGGRPSHLFYLSINSFLFCLMSHA